MLDRASLERFLEEQKTERKHQLDFIGGLQTTYFNLHGELNKQGWKSMESLLVLMDVWGKNLSLAERQINELEQLLKNK